MLKPILFRLMVALLLVGSILPIFETGEAVADGAITHGTPLNNGMTGLVAFSDGRGEGHSLSQNIPAWNNGVTDGDPISVTITLNSPTGLSFGNPIPGTVKQPEATTPSITITNETTGLIAVYLMGTDFTGAGTITIDNAFYNNTNDPVTAQSMPASYGILPWMTLDSGASLDIYHWLTIPTGTPAGSYSSEFTYKTEEAP